MERKIEKTTVYDKTGIGDIVEIWGMKCRVIAVRLEEDGHDCNKDICKRCAYPDPDRYHLEALPLEGERKRVEQEKAEAQAKRDADEAAFMDSHELIGEFKSIDITRAFKKATGRKHLRVGDKTSHMGVGFERILYGNHYGVQEAWSKTSDDVVQRGNAYYRKA